MTKQGKLHNLFVNRGKDFIVIIVLIVLFSLLLEQTIRYYMFGMDSFSYHKMNSIGSLGKSGFIQASSNPAIVYELKPNLDSYLKLADFKTNSQGLRDKEYSIEKPHDTFRIAVIGGSYTLPSGVGIDDAYHTVLENRLNEESRGLSYEVINFGVGGYTTKNKLATLKYKALDYEPDLILFVLDGSQLADEEDKDFVPKERKNNFFQSFAFKLFLKSKVINYLFKDHSIYLEEQYENLDKLDKELGELREISDEHGVPILVVELDHDYSSLKLAEEIGSLVKKHNLYYSNTVPAFRNTYYKDFSIYEIDAHPNATAHRIFAEVIYIDLQKHSLIRKE